MYRKKRNDTKKERKRISMCKRTKWREEGIKEGRKEVKGEKRKLSWCWGERKKKREWWFDDGIYKNITKRKNYSKEEKERKTNVEIKKKE